MEHSIREEGGAVIASFSGEVDLEHSPKAREVLLSCVDGATKVLVDLSGVSYIDSSGVATLVEGFQVSRQKALDFALVGVSNTAMSVLQLARLDRVFPIFESLQARLEAKQ